MTSIKFGEDLELDLRAYELRRATRPVRLERIPMEILLLLVERRGELVTREQIIGRVWGNDISFDTDNGINGGIRKIRQALRDDPENPRFISTVTGKGYRFIAALTEDSAGQPGVLPPTPTETPPLSEAPKASMPSVDVPGTGIPRRWPLLLALGLLAGAAGAYTLWSRSSSATRQPGERVMLAVLPFENLTGDPGQDYFSDGLTEEMITRLANLEPRQIGVIARTSVMRYKQTPASLESMARDLGVQYILEGSVRRDSGSLRITAQLIQLKDQSHVWARQYDRKQPEVLAVQAEIAQAIAEQVGFTFGEHGPSPAEPAALSSEDLEAYDHYLKGRYYLNKRTRDDLQRAITSFQQSLTGRPDDARAYAGMADSYTLIANYGWVPHADVIPKAREAALKALQIDERLAAAHTSLALINEFYDRDWQMAENRYRRALELDQNYATAHHWYAEFLAFQGRFDEALAEFERARRLDPLSPIIAADHGVILYFARQYERAIQQFRFVLTIEPVIGRAHLIVAVYAQQGQFDEALAHIREWQKSADDPWPWSWAAYLYGRSGRQAEAREALQKMEEGIQRWQQDPFLLRATAYLGMDRTQEALASLQRECETNPSALMALKVDPVFDPLREDSRFDDLLRCAGFTR